ncbi:MAG TPA: protein translocase subunit SecF [Polyangia bacterium]|jgi:preprotein translocase subunit SecF|nr:protein translocase subunit SecF [Polyangia bacterium]
MPSVNSQQKFFEVIKPGSTYEFIGRQRYWIGLSIVLVTLTFVMLPLNAYVFKSRGHMLNWGVDFRGGSEIVIEFSKPVEAGEIRKTLTDAGLPDADVVKYADPSGLKKWNYMIRVAAVSVVSEQQAKQIQTSLAHEGDAALKRFEFTEGGDKLYLRYDKSVDPSALAGALKALGVNTNQVQPFGRPDEHTYEVTLTGLDTEIRRALDARLGEGAVAAIPSVESVGAKAGKQLQFDGARSLLYAILLIMVYIAFRFDLRYGPGTVVALLHDAVITVGAFAVTYKEFSLTTVAAVLTVIGYSMNDTIVVFDRIRENATRLRDRRFDRIVNQSINETLSRTLLTSATVLFVTLAMNVFGVGVIRDFAFALNIGVLVGTYSSIFIASPILIWLNDKYVTSQKRQQASGRNARRGRKDEDEPEV